MVALVLGRRGEPRGHDPYQDIFKVGCTPLVRPLAKVKCTPELSSLRTKELDLSPIGPVEVLPMNDLGTGASSDKMPVQQN